jgi:S1-C subfamily serine protease
MKLRLLLSAVVLALGVHGAAATEEGTPTDKWVQAFQSNTGETLYFDALNVRREGGIVTYWERVVFQKPQKLSRGETYTQAVSENTTECGSDWYAMKALMVLNERGEPIRNNELNGERVKIERGSLEWNTQAAVCKFVGRVSGLKSVVIDLLGDSPQWTPLGELQPGVTADLSRASIRKRGALSTVVIRFSYSQPSTGPAEFPIRNMYSRFDIDCGRSRLREREADFTDDNGRLVDIRPVSDGAVEFTDIPEGTTGPIVRRMVCGEASGPAAENTKAAAAGRSGPAAGQTWTLVSRSPTKVEYSVDPSTIRQHGKYIESWQRELPPKNVRVGADLTYRSVVVHVLDDCAAGTSADLNVLFYNDKGGIAKSTDYDEAKLQFRAQSPHSVGDIMQDYVCAYALRVADLKPNLALDIFSNTEWIALGESERYSKTELARSSIKRDGSKVVFAMRARGRTSLKSFNDMDYQIAYEAWTIDCDLSTSAILTADYYDQNGRLVDVARVADPASLTFTPIQTPSPLVTAKKFACAEQAAGQDDEPTLGVGTAWFGPKGYLITASHVVRGATSILVAQDGNPVGEAEVVVDDPRNDVAILKPSFTARGLHPLIALAPSPAQLGEHVFTLGYPAPDDLGLSVKLTSGEVSSLKGSDPHGGIDDARLMQISVSVQHGNSGGPLFDDRGQAVGIILAGFDPNSGLQNVNYAIKIAYVRSLLAELPDIGGYRPLKAAASVAGLASELRNSVFMLLVSSEKDK